MQWIALHRRTTAWIVAVSLLVTGCRASRQIHDPQYLQLAQAMAYPTAPVAALPPPVPEFAGAHPVEEYLRFALEQNPQVWAARKRVEAAANRVPQQASLEDPTVSVMNWPDPDHAPQTASGRMVVDVSVGQEVPWFGTLQTRAAVAEAETNMARAQLASAELEVVEQVRRAYYELYYLQQAIEVNERERQLVQDFAIIAEAKYRANTASQQDVLRAQLELTELERTLIELRQQLLSAQARMARLLHLSPETPLRALEDLPEGEIPEDLERLYARAVAARPDLHAQLAEIRRDRGLVELARLQYYPDVGVTFDWGAMTTDQAIAPTADGFDNLGLGIMANVPIYRKRLAAGVREAEARAVASAREYDALRDQTLENVKDLFVQAESQEELLELFDEAILPKARQTLEVSVEGYRAGQVDFLQLIDNWRQLLRYQLARYRVQSQLYQTLASLERVIGGRLPPPELRVEVERLPPVPPEPGPAAREPGAAGPLEDL